MSWAIAAGHKAGKIGRRVMRALKAEGEDAYFVSGRNAKAFGASVVEAHRAGDRLMAVGGDGTLNLIIDALFQEEPAQPPTLGVVRGGTGTDFARMFAIPEHPVEAVRKAVRGEDYPTDVMELSGSWGTRRGINVFEAGLGAATVKFADRMPRWTGPVKYETAFWAALPTFRPSRFTLEVEGRTFEGKGLVVVAANGEFFGGGMRIAPKASLVDGMFDMIIVDVPRREAFTLFPRMKQGLHLNHPGVRRVTTPWFRLTTDPAWPVEVDGEFLGNAPVEGKILPGAINVRV